MRYNLTTLYFKYCLVVATTGWISTTNLAASISRLILAKWDDLKLLYLCHWVACTSCDLDVGLEWPLVCLIWWYLWSDLSRDLLFLLLLKNNIKWTQMLLTRNKRLQPTIGVSCVTWAEDWVIFITGVVPSHFWGLEKSLSCDFVLRVVVRVLTRCNAEWIDIVLLLLFSEAHRRWVAIHDCGQQVFRLHLGWGLLFGTERGEGVAHRIFLRLMCRLTTRAYQ